MEEENKIELKDPTKEMMDSPEFNAVWELMKSWEIHIPGIDEADSDGVASEATGNHVRAVLDAIKSSRPLTVKQVVTKLKYQHLGNTTREKLILKLDEMIGDTVI